VEPAITTEGRRLGAKHARQLAALETTRAEIDQWVEARVSDGWSIYHIAKVLGMADPAIRRKLEARGIAYEPKPKGGPGKVRAGGAR
jgi:hypothetical protein